MVARSYEFTGRLSDFNEEFKARYRRPDGPGGTAHLVNVASKWGFKTVELDARELLKN